MELFKYLFKTKEYARLAELLWVDKVSGSVNELAHLADLSYSTAHEELQRMKSLGLVKMQRVGKATLYSSALTEVESKVVKNLFSKTNLKRKTVSFADYNLPLLGDFNELLTDNQLEPEELLVKSVKSAKKNATLLRVLPLMLKKMGAELNLYQLVYWAKRYEVNRELGFLLDLTAALTKNTKFSKLAKQFKDKRWSKPEYFFESDSNLSGFQEQLTEKNTPELAKKWYLKLNMGLDSFQSLYSKYEKAYS